MKIFALKLIIFIALATAIDYSIGSIFHLYKYSKGGEIGKIHHIMTEETPGAIILGSSRACHHYIPYMLQDSLKLKTYNAGLDGQGLVFGYGLLSGIARRSFPKVMICEITPAFDLFENYAPSLNNLFPYSNCSIVKDMILDFDKNAKYKILSNAYKLNSALFRLIPSIFKEVDNKEGYKPSYGTLETNKQINNIKNEKVYFPIIDITKEKYLRRLIEEAHNNDCQLVFAISPEYGGADLSQYQYELSIIREYGLPVFNHLNDSNFINNPLLFSDKVHLNDAGAKEYTKIIINEMIQIN